MIRWMLKRLASSDSYATRGELLREDGSHVCFTLELPWKNNQPQISCVLPGTYTCVRVISPSKGEVFEITGVPGRTHILIHKANWPFELLGCVAPGEAFAADIEGKGAGITGSKDAFDSLMKELEGADELELTITAPAELVT